MPRKSPVRNNQVESSLASSTNGGQFANKKHAPSDAVIVSPDALPVGHEHIPAPATGQTLHDGTPAPSSFAEAWAQTFKPLHDLERTTGRSIGKPHLEFERSLLEEIGANDVQLGSRQSVEVTRERFGSYLTITADGESQGAGCNHPSSADQKACSGLRCGCTHCVYLHAPQFDGFLSVEEGYDDWDEQETVALELKLPDEALAKANIWLDKVASLGYLIELRANAKKAPWIILSEIEVEEPEDTEEAKAARAEREAKSVALEPFRGIDKHGWASPLSDAVKDPSTLAYELEHISRATNTFAKKPAKRGVDPLAERERTIRYYKGLYEQHEETVASISDVEKELGRSLPESITKPALEKEGFGHRQYLYGHLKGQARKKEIVQALTKANSEYKEGADEEKAVLAEMKAQRTWGAGWPEGAYEAPSRTEWAEMTGGEKTLDPWL